MNTIRKPFSPPDTGPFAPLSLKHPTAVGAADETQNVLILAEPDQWDIDMFLMIETMRFANQTLGQHRYNWQFKSSTDNGGLACGHPMSGACDLVIVPSLTGDLSRPDSETSARIRRYYSRGATICATGTGPFHLAAAGILSGQPVTLPPDYMTVFTELFPSADVTNQAYTAGNRILTCAGGVNVIHLMAHLTAEVCGRDLALKIADHFQIERLRSVNEPSPHSRNFRNALPAPLARSLSMMEEAIETPVRMAAIADDVRLSIRQLERLFMKHLNATPTEYYRRLRLDRARILLETSHMPITEVTYMTGFASPSHFAKSFRDAYGVSPSDIRCANT